MPPYSPPYPVLSRDGVAAPLDLILWPGRIGGAPPQGVTAEGLSIDVDPGRYSICFNKHCSTVDVGPATQMKVDASQ